MLIQQGAVIGSISCVGFASVFSSFKVGINRTGCLNRSSCSHWRLFSGVSVASRKLPSKKIELTRQWCHFSSRPIVMDTHGDVKKNEGCRGALVVLEGLDRSGKSSQATKLVEYLQERGVSTELWRFPDRNTEVGRMISAYLTNKSQLDDHTIHLLFSANRWEKRPLMESKLNAGTSLIVDRYSYSGVAFSSAKGLDVEWCKAPEVGLLAPDLVIYLDIPPEKAAERGGYGGERYEHLDFQRKVAEKYHALRDSSWKIVDACLPLEDVQKQLRELLMGCMSSCQEGKPLSLLWSP